MAAENGGPIRIDLRRNPGEPWGFRLQGGTDFQTALSVQSVNPGGVSERAGLRAGDAVLEINGRPSDELEHEQAKQIIMAAGDNVLLIVQRGAVKIWKPKVTPMSELRPQELNMEGYEDRSYVQKTSLAADKKEVQHIGSGYNRTARPFMAGGGGGPAGGGGTVPAIVNAQYNTPIKLYSADNTVETFKHQSDILASNIEGRNQFHQPAAYEGEGGGGMPSGMRSVKAPVFDPSKHEVQQAEHMTCKICGRLVVGVFVRIKGDPMHPECFKCVQCGKNLKNQGYFNINGQMYCEVHAKQASQAGPGMQAQVIYR